MRAPVAIAVIGSAALLLVSGAAGWWWYSRPDSQIKDAVRNTLVDPDSAQFYEVKVDRNSGYGCGLVNAKNKLGGYTGKRRFVATTTGKVTLDPEEKEPDYSSRSEPSTGLPQLPSFSMAENLARSQQELSEVIAERQRMNIWRAKVEEARALNTVFAQLMSENCPK